MSSNCHDEIKLHAIFNITILIYVAPVYYKKKDYPQLQLAFKKNIVQETKHRLFFLHIYYIVTSCSPEYPNLVSTFLSSSFVRFSDFIISEGCKPPILMQNLFFFYFFFNNRQSIRFRKGFTPAYIAINRYWSTGIYIYILFLVQATEHRRQITLSLRLEIRKRCNLPKSIVAA